jgi:axial budding pattern protein 2
VRIPPSWSFSIGFQYYTFSDGDRKIYYTAYRAGTTYLPDWLTFDNETVTFGGLAPANTNYFEIDLYGSDHYGYADVKQTFALVVGSHSFILQGPLPPINATAKDTVEYTIPISGLMLDAQRISSTNLTSVVANIPSNASYLTYDASSRTISGTLPAEIPSTDDLYIPVTFTSIFNDTIVTNVTLSITSQLFSQSNLPSVNITGGQYFSHSLATYLTSSETSYSAAFDPANASEWLQFDNSSKALEGTPPIDGQDVLVNITAVDAPSGVIESATLTLLYSNPKTQLQKGGGGGLSNGAKIALAVVFGILGGLLLLGLIMWLCRRYCHHEDNVDDDATLAAASEKGRYRQTPISTGRASMGGSTDSDRLSQAIVAAELSIANAMAREQSKPKRIDLMNVFGGGKKTPSSREMPTTQSGRSMKEILGLTANRANYPSPTEGRQHQIITVTDGDGYTYRPTTPTGPPALVVRNASISDEDAGSPDLSDGTRSSFDSRQSSSLFYSEEGGSNESPVQRPAASHTRKGTPRSIPRRRRDFLPYRPPPRKSSAENSMSTDAITPPVQGIRIVPPRRASEVSTIADVSYNAQVSALDYNAALAADAAIATAHLEQLNEPGTAASVHSFGSRPHSTPRLIPFTSEKRGERAGSPPEKRFSSQRGIHSESGHVSLENSREDAIDESTEDSPFDDNVQRYSTVSQPYCPPELGDASPIYFSTSPSGREANQQTPSPESTRSIPRSTRSRANTNSMFVEPFRIQLNAGDPFHFTAQIHPPPMATIGSPGRDGCVDSSCSFLGFH